LTLRSPVRKEAKRAGKKKRCPKEKNHEKGKKRALVDK